MTGHLELLHVTTASAAESIRRSGFQPTIGPRSAELGETTPATYFFTSAEALAAASYNWLSEAFEDVDEPLVVLVVSVPAGSVRIDPRAGFEARAVAPVPAASIIRGYDIDTGRDVA